MVRPVTNWVDKQCVTVEWFTPPRILEAVRLVVGDPIPLDPATTFSNPTRAKRIYTASSDGLSQPWDEPWFLNPPYGKQFPLWCQKAAHAMAPGVGLFPCGARFGTRYFQTMLASPHLTGVCWVRGRVKFLRPDGQTAPQNPYDSALYGFGVDPMQFAVHLAPLGVCWLVGHP